MRLREKEREIEELFRFRDIKGKIEVIADNRGACIEIESPRLSMESLAYLYIYMSFIGYEIISIAYSSTSGFSYHIDCEVIS